MFDRKSDLVRFLTVVDIGNAFVASRELGLTHQAMSYTLGVLRRRAGGALFERQPAGLRLTPLGVEAEALARRLLRAHEDGEGRLESHREGRSGRLHVAAAAGFLQTVLPAAAAFHDDHPGVDVNLHPAGDDVLDLLDGGECDLYCSPVMPQDVPAELRRTRLPAVSVGLVAARGHPLEDREPGWRDLADHPWIDYGAEPLGLACGRASLAALHADIRGHTGRPVRRIMRAGGGGLELMRTGPYLSQLPFDHLDRLPGRFLVPLAGKIGRGTVRAGVLTRRSDDALPATRRLREALAAAAAGENQ